MIFDGFPRTINQAKELKKMLAARDSKVHAVIGLEVDPRGVYGNQHGIYTIRGIKREYVPLDEGDNRLTFDTAKSPPEWQDATTETTPWD